jgi:predicted pyridoxine 5'-phosphate oxidase superfamily flavin-nucleotide-binding protein
MSELYGGGHRFFQDQHGTRPLADRLEALAHSEFDARDRAFIEQVNMFFLATLDERGRPTVSYKGGAPGFVRITGPSELVFPVYDGNGMFLTLGNIAATASVGLLFIDFEAPRRLRVQGIAKVLVNDNLDTPVPGALYLVQVTAQQIFVNCGRYIHKTGTQSPHVPDAAGQQPFPAWKRLDLFTGALPEKDQRKVEEAGGTLTVDDYRGES